MWDSTLTQTNGSHYIAGEKYCSTSECYIFTQQLFCECCGMRLRAKSTLWKSIQGKSQNKPAPELYNDHCGYGPRLYLLYQIGDDSIITIEFFIITMTIIWYPGKKITERLTVFHYCNWCIVRNSYMVRTDIHKDSLFEFIFRVSYLSLS